LSPLFGFYVSAFGLLIIVLLFFPALITLLSRGRDTAWGALLLGLGGVGLLGLVIKLSIASPLRDVTTDYQNPPQFKATSFLVKAPGSEDLLDSSFHVDKSYDPGQSALQVKALPEIEPLAVKATADKTYPTVEKVMRQQFPQWKILRADPKERHLEVEAESGLFRFIDDVVIEVRPGKDPADSTVEIRSRSRVGQSDLGANGRRINDIKLRISIAIAEAEALDAPRRQALAQEEAARVAAAKAAEEAARKSQEEALEAGKLLTAPRVNPDILQPKGPPRDRPSPYREKPDASSN